ERWLFRILVERAAHEQDRRWGISRRQFFRQEIQELRQPHGTVEIKLRVCRPKALLGEEKFQVANDRGKLVGARFWAIKDPRIWQRNLGDGLQLESIVNGQGTVEGQVLHEEPDDASIHLVFHRIVQKR